MDFTGNILWIQYYPAITEPGIDGKLFVIARISLSVTTAYIKKEPIM